MKVFLVNMLPKEVGDRVRSLGERRRLGLLVSLLLISLVGVSFHSWDQARRARAVRDAAVVSRERIDDVDAELARLEADRARLGAFMTAYHGIASPMELSDLLATIVNAMPPRASLTDLSMKLELRQAAEGAPAAPQPAPTPPGGNAPRPPPKRVLELRLRGYAASNAEVTAFERSLAATAPLVRVTLGENRSMETPDGNFQEFIITAEVPLDRKYITPRETGPLALDHGATAGVVSR